MALRRLLHSKGLRYRVDIQPLPTLRRKADVVFSRDRVAVYVDGCFWHGCPIHGTSPKANGTWWAEKLGRNISRDRDTDLRLQDAGWTDVRVWEHDDFAAAAAEVERAVRVARTRRAGRQTF